MEGEPIVTMMLDDEMTGIEQLEAIVRLNREAVGSAVLLSRSDARYLVDLYYSIQEYRIRAAGQARAADGGADNPVLFMRDEFVKFEHNAQRLLAAYSNNHRVGRWSRSIMGIGPVLAAGLLAHVDIEQAPTVGHIWRFAGLDPTVTWDKGEKRPWNVKLKTMCWKIGESFVKVSGRDNDIYGHVYSERKALEIARNDAGEYAEQAAAALAHKRYGQETIARAWYEQGKLPPAHIHARAKRYAVKLYLAHWQHVAYETHYGNPPPMPYIIQHGGHVDYLAPPNWPMD